MYAKIVQTEGNEPSLLGVIAEVQGKQTLKSTIHSKRCTKRLAGRCRILPINRRRERILPFCGNSPSQVKGSSLRLKNEVMNMMTRVALAAFGATLFMGSAFAQTIELPAPSKTGGKPLMEVLNERKSTRDGYVNEDLDLQTLSDLLWSAYGFNRVDKRTVPSANDSQEFSVYALLNKGAYLYDARGNALQKVADGTYRDLLANQKQPYVNDVPVHLVYVGNVSKSKAGREGMLMDVGFISQNVYLYAASKGLGTVVRASFDGRGLAKVLKLQPQQTVVLVQAVGRVK